MTAPICRPTSRPAASRSSKPSPLDLGEDIEFRRSGALQAIHTPRAIRIRARAGEDPARPGPPGRLLSTREARTIEPGFAPSLLGRCIPPLRSQADPQKATRAFATLAERRGARVLTHHEVTAIESRAGAGFVAHTPRGAVAAGELVLAAGAWCGPLGAMLDLEIPIVPVRGQMWATPPVTPSVFQTISSAQSAHSWHSDPGRGAALSDDPARAGASPVISTAGNDGTARSSSAAIASWSAGRPRRIRPASRSTALTPRRCSRSSPTLPIARTWAGLMPFPLDGKPLIGRIAGVSICGS